VEEYEQRRRKKNVRITGDLTDGQRREGKKKSTLTPYKER